MNFFLNGNSISPTGKEIEALKIFLKKIIDKERLDHETIKTNNVLVWKWSGDREASLNGLDLYIIFNHAF